ncbi:MAG: hypothetical protein BGO76_08005 [Caedibacter sp. 38-128]|nr:hypothetical protein [Holosporales bacterium]OJX03252.1 MAG: hypothetical protein BGO76_08005 [Caedibacter sp. 38-128]
MASKGLKFLWEKLDSKINGYLKSIGLSKPFNEYKISEEIVSDGHKSLNEEKENLQKALGLKISLRRIPSLLII